MKTLQRSFILAAASLLAALSLTGCGGGSSSTPPANSSSGVTTGAVTGFGSIFVNGIEFSRKSGLPNDRVNFKFEGQNQAEDQLKVGMVVRVTGSFNSSTGKGEYEAVEFQPELRGRLDDAGVDQVNNRLTIMNRTVQLDANTQFDSIRDLAELSADLGNANHPEIEVSGNLDNSGVLHATRIAKKSLNFSNGGAVELKGQVAAAPAPTGNGFSIGTTAIIVNDSTQFQNMLRTDLATAAGSMLEVKATLNAGIFTATRVEKKKAVEAELNDNVNIKGIAAGAIDNNTFTLNGPNGPVLVKVSGASFSNRGAAATSSMVTAGALLEVEGSLDASGAIVASKVEIELEKNLKLEGNALAGAFNQTAGTITLNGVTLKIAATTRLRDSSVNPAVTLNLASIAAGDHLQITGLISSPGVFQASEVQRTKPGNGNLAVIQGPATASGTTLAILGVTIDTSTITQASDFIDNGSGVKIPGTGTPSQAQAAFLAKIQSGTTVVKAKGSFSGTTLSASEVEIERPS